MPAVSVLMPVLDADPAFLRAAVRSILEQSLRELELIVVEDPSPHMCGELLAGFGDPRIRYFANPARSSFAAQLNRGLAEARAGLVARMDADDIAEPQRLELQLRRLSEDPGLDVLGAQLCLIDPAGRLLGQRAYPTDHERIVRALRRRNALAHPAVMFRKARVLDAGGYRASELYPVEDYELWCRLARGGARFANLGETLLRYRIHARASKSQATRRTLRNSLIVKRMHWRGQLDWGDRLRLGLEHLLLLLPEAAIQRLFLLSELRRGSRALQ